MLLLLCQVIYADKGLHLQADDECMSSDHKKVGYVADAVITDDQASVVALETE